VQGVQTHPQKFCFVENLDKMPETPSKNGAQLSLKKMAPNVCRKAHENLFLEVTPKRSS